MKTPSPKVPAKQSTLSCRAQVSPSCYDGSPIDPEDPMEDDGTYEPFGPSVVCDACYLELMPFTKSGKALIDELEPAIAFLRKQLEHIRGYTDEQLELGIKAMKHAAEQSTPDTPRQRSAAACAKLAEQELASRA